MKKLEDIEKEYEGYTTDKPYITNLMEFFCYIEIGLDSLVEDQDVAVKERRSLKSIAKSQTVQKESKTSEKGIV